VGVGRAQAAEDFVSLGWIHRASFIARTAAC
jgi:hypothetical protein